jgi:predicted dehydrogenase
MSVRVGLVGCGGNVAARHMKHLHNNSQAELAAVCDIVTERAALAGKQYGAAPYTSFDAMLEEERLDALFLCVPPFAHDDMEEKAASRGIHLFVEKPVGLTRDTVLRKAEAIRRSGVISATGYCLRYMDAAGLARKYVSGKKLAMVRAHYLTTFVETPWWRDAAKSGGQLVEQATHVVDLIRYVAGDMTRVSALSALRVMDDVPGISIPDVGTMQFTLASGAIGTLDIGFTQPDHRMSVEWIGRDFRVVLDGQGVTFVEPGRTEIVQSANDFYRTQDDAFIEAILSGNRGVILAPYEEGVATLMATLAANDSAKTGAPVDI